MVKTFQHIKLKKKYIMSNYLITVTVVSKHIEQTYIANIQQHTFRIKAVLETVFPLLYDERDGPPRSK